MEKRKKMTIKINQNDRNNAFSFSHKNTVHSVLQKLLVHQVQSLAFSDYLKFQSIVSNTERN